MRDAVGRDLPDRPAGGAAADVDVPLRIDRDRPASRASAPLSRPDVTTARTASSLPAAVSRRIWRPVEMYSCPLGLSAMCSSGDAEPSELTAPAVPFAIRLQRLAVAGDRADHAVAADDSHPSAVGDVERAVGREHEIGDARQLGSHRGATVA